MLNENNEGVLLTSNVISNEKPISGNWDDLNKDIGSLISLLSDEISSITDKSITMLGYKNSLDDIKSNTDILLSKSQMYKGIVSSTESLYTKFLEYKYHLESLRSNYKVVKSSISVIELTKEKE